jgi:hypothetical protein
MKKGKVRQAPVGVDSDGNGGARKRWRGVGVTTDIVGAIGGVTLKDGRIANIQDIGKRINVRAPFAVSLVAFDKPLPEGMEKGERGHDQVLT